MNDNQYAVRLARDELEHRFDGVRYMNKTWQPVEYKRDGSVARWALVDGTASPPPPADLTQARARAIEVLKNDEPSGPFSPQAINLAVSYLRLDEQLSNSQYNKEEIIEAVTDEIWFRRQSGTTAGLERIFELLTGRKYGSPDNAEKKKDPPPSADDNEKSVSE